MNKSVLFFGVVVAIAATMQSCYYDKAYEILPGVAPCDTTSFTYSGEVSPVLLQYCMPCHSTQDASSGVILDTYDEVRKVVNNGFLMGSIKRESGFSPMPKNGPQLDPCTIRIIELWVEDGAPDN